MAGGGRTIYVAGAGIAGLTLALSLAKFGAPVVVLERNDAVAEAGAGVQISPNARRILNQLGLDRQVGSRSFEPEGIDLYPFGATHPAATLKLGATARGRYGVPYAVMHRGDLADVLFRATRRFTNIQIKFGIRAFDVIGGVRGVSVTWQDRDGVTHSGRGFAFIGADGVNSRTRTKIMGGAIAERHSRVAWRTLLDINALGGQLAPDRTSLLFGPGCHAVCYPLPHRGKLNVALFARYNLTGTERPTRPSVPRSLLASAVFKAMLEAAGDSWTYWPVGTVSADDWSRGNIGLIGDAAHAMLPFQAQGAAMAIEDAAILAPLLITEASAASALERYVSLRRARVDRVARVAASNGFAFHLPWPLSMARDSVLRLQGDEGHLKRLDWLYGYDAAPDVELKAPARPPARTPGNEKVHRE